MATEQLPPFSDGAAALRGAQISSGHLNPAFYRRDQPALRRQRQREEKKANILLLGRRYCCYW